MAMRHAMGLALGGAVLLVAGIAIGIWQGRWIDAALPTDRFIADRMAECGLTVRLHEHALETGDARLRELVAGDVVGCGLLVSMHRDRIPAGDLDTAERIELATEPLVAVR